MGGAQFALINGSWMGDAAIAMSMAWGGSYGSSGRSNGLNDAGMLVVEQCWQLGESINYYAMLRNRQEAETAARELAEFLIGLFGVLLGVVGGFEFEILGLIGKALVLAGRSMGEVLAGVTRAAEELGGSIGKGATAAVTALPKPLGTLVSGSASVVRFGADMTWISSASLAAGDAAAGLGVGWGPPVPLNGNQALGFLVGLVEWGPLGVGAYLLTRAVVKGLGTKHGPRSAVGGGLGPVNSADVRGVPGQDSSFPFDSRGGGDPGASFGGVGSGAPGGIAGKGLSKQVSGPGPDAGVAVKEGGPSAGPGGLPSGIAPTAGPGGPHRVGAPGPPVAGEAGLGGGRGVSAGDRPGAPGAPGAPGGSGSSGGPGGPGGGESAGAGHGVSPDTGPGSGSADSGGVRRQVGSPGGGRGSGRAVPPGAVDSGGGRGPATLPGGIDASASAAGGSDRSGGAIGGTSRAGGGVDAPPVGAHPAARLDADPGRTSSGGVGVGRGGPERERSGSVGNTDAPARPVLRETKAHRDVRDLVVSHAPVVESHVPVVQGHVAGAQGRPPVVEGHAAVVDGRHPPVVENPDRSGADGAHQAAEGRPGGAGAWRAEPVVDGSGAVRQADSAVTAGPVRPGTTERAPVAHEGQVQGQGQGSLVRHPEAQSPRAVAAVRSFTPVDGTAVRAAGESRTGASAVAPQGRTPAQVRAQMRAGVRPEAEQAEQAGQAGHAPADVPEPDAGPRGESAVGPSAHGPGQPGLRADARTHEGAGTDAATPDAADPGPALVSPGTPPHGSSRPEEGTSRRQWGVGDTDTGHGAAGSGRGVSPDGTVVQPQFVKHTDGKHITEGDGLLDLGDGLPPAHVPAGSEGVFDASGELRLVTTPDGGASFDRFLDGGWQRREQPGELITVKLSKPFPHGVDGVLGSEMVLDKGLRGDGDRIAEALGPDNGHLLSRLAGDGLSTAKPVAIRTFLRGADGRVHTETVVPDGDGGWRRPTSPSDLASFEAGLAAANKVPGAARRLYDIAARPGLQGLHPDELRDMLLHGSDADRDAASYAAVVRGTGKAPRGTQMAGYDAFGDDMVLNMSAGEGKSLVYLMDTVRRAALAGVDAVHVITTRDNLADREAAIYREVLEPLGYTVHRMNHTGPPPPVVKGEPTVYVGTGEDVGFTYLNTGRLDGRPVADGGRTAADGSDRLVIHANVDEVDEAVEYSNTTYILSEGPERAAAPEVAASVKAARALADGMPENLLTGRPGDKAAPGGLTDAAREWAQGQVGHELSADEAHRLTMALLAKNAYKQDIHYVTFDRGDGNGERVYIVDQTTHQVMYNPRTSTQSRWNNGLAQAIEAKHGLEIRGDSRSSKEVTFMRLLGDQYDRAVGASATAHGKSTLFAEGGLSRGGDPVRIVDIDRYFYHQLDRRPDVVSPTMEAKVERVADDAYREHTQTGRPQVIIAHRNDLVATITEHLKAKGATDVAAIDARWTLQQGANREEAFASVVAEAGGPGRILVVNMQGARGVDIGVHAEARGLGGLHVRVTAHSDVSDDIDIQAENRAARSGDPGSVTYYASPDDGIFQLPHGNPDVGLAIIKYRTAHEQHTADAGPGRGPLSLHDAENGLRDLIRPLQQIANGLRGMDLPAYQPHGPPSRDTFFAPGTDNGQFTARTPSHPPPSSTDPGGRPEEDQLAVGTALPGGARSPYDTALGGQPPVASAAASGVPGMDGSVTRDEIGSVEVYPPTQAAEEAGGFVAPIEVMTPPQGLPAGWTAARLRLAAFLATHDGDAVRSMSPDGSRTVVARAEGSDDFTVEVTIGTDRRIASYRLVPAPPAAPAGSPGADPAQADALDAAGLAPDFVSDLVSSVNRALARHMMWTDLHPNWTPDGVVVRQTVAEKYTKGLERRLLHEQADVVMHRILGVEPPGGTGSGPGVGHVAYLSEDEAVDVVYNWPHTSSVAGRPRSPELRDIDSALRALPQPLTTAALMPVMRAVSTWKAANSQQSADWQAVSDLESAFYGILFNASHRAYTAVPHAVPEAAPSGAVPQAVHPARFPDFFSGPSRREYLEKSAEYGQAAARTLGSDPYGRGKLDHALRELLRRYYVTSPGGFTEDLLHRLGDGQTSVDARAGLRGYLQASRTDPLPFDELMGKFERAVPEYARRMGLAAPVGVQPRGASLDAAMRERGYLGSADLTVEQLQQARDIELMLRVHQHLGPQGDDVFTFREAVAGWYLSRPGALPWEWFLDISHRVGVRDEQVEPDPWQTDLSRVHGWIQGQLDPLERARKQHSDQATLERVWFPPHVTMYEERTRPLLSGEVTGRGDWVNPVSFAHDPLGTGRTGSAAAPWWSLRGKALRSLLRDPAMLETLDLLATAHSMALALVAGPDSALFRPGVLTGPGALDRLRELVRAVGRRAGAGDRTSWPLLMLRDPRIRGVVGGSATKADVDKAVDDFADAVGEPFLAEVRRHASMAVEALDMLPSRPADSSAAFYTRMGPGPLFGKPAFATGREIHPEALSTASSGRTAALQTLELAVRHGQPQGQHVVLIEQVRSFSLRDVSFWSWSGQHQGKAVSPVAMTLQVVDARWAKDETTGLWYEHVLVTEKLRPTSSTGWDNEFLVRDIRTPQGEWLGFGSYNARDTAIFTPTLRHMLDMTHLRTYGKGIAKNQFLEHWPLPGGHDWTGRPRLHVGAAHGLQNAVVKIGRFGRKLVNGSADGVDTARRMAEAGAADATPLLQFVCNMGAERPGLPTVAQQAADEHPQERVLRAANTVVASMPALQDYILLYQTWGSTPAPGLLPFTRAKGSGPAAPTPSAEPYLAGQAAGYPGSALTWVEGAKEYDAALGTWLASDTAALNLMRRVVGKIGAAGTHQVPADLHRLTLHQLVAVALGAAQGAYPHLAYLLGVSADTQRLLRDWRGIHHHQGTVPNTEVLYRLYRDLDLPSGELPTFVKAVFGWGLSEKQPLAVLLRSLHRSRISRNQAVLTAALAGSGAHLYGLVDAMFETGAGLAAARPEHLRLPHWRQYTRGMSYIADGHDGIRVPDDLMRAVRLLSSAVKPPARPAAVTLSAENWAARHAAARASKADGRPSPVERLDPAHVVALYLLSDDASRVFLESGAERLPADQGSALLEGLVRQAIGEAFDRAAGGGGLELPVLLRHPRVREQITKVQAAGPAPGSAQLDELRRQMLGQAPGLAGELRMQLPFHLGLAAEGLEQLPPVGRRVYYALAVPRQGAGAELREVDLRARHQVFLDRDEALSKLGRGDAHRILVVVEKSSARDHTVLAKDPSRSQVRYGEPTRLVLKKHTVVTTDGGDSYEELLMEELPSVDPQKALDAVKGVVAAAEDLRSLEGGSASHGAQPGSDGPAPHEEDGVRTSPEPAAPNAYDVPVASHPLPEQERPAPEPGSDRGGAEPVTVEQLMARLKVGAVDGTAVIGDEESLGVVQRWEDGTLKLPGDTMAGVLLRWKDNPGYRVEQPALAPTADDLEKVAVAIRSTRTRPRSQVLGGVDARLPGVRDAAPGLKDFWDGQAGRLAGLVPDAEDAAVRAARHVELARNRSHAADSDLKEATRSRQAAAQRTADPAAQGEAKAAVQRAEAVVRRAEDASERRKARLLTLNDQVAGATMLAARLGGLLDSLGDLAAGASAEAERWQAEGLAQHAVDLVEFAEARRAGLSDGRAPGPVPDDLESIGAAVRPADDLPGARALRAVDDRLPGLRELARDLVDSWDGHAAQLAYRVPLADSAAAVARDEVRRLLAAGTDREDAEVRRALDAAERQEAGLRTLNLRLAAAGRLALRVGAVLDELDALAGGSEGEAERWRAEGLSQRAVDLVGSAEAVLVGLPTAGLLGRGRDTGAFTVHQGEDFVRLTQRVHLVSDEVDDDEAARVREELVYALDGWVNAPGQRVPGDASPGPRLEIDVEFVGSRGAADRVVRLFPGAPGAGRTSTASMWYTDAGAAANTRAYIDGLDIFPDFGRRPLPEETDTGGVTERAHTFEG